MKSRDSVSSTQKGVYEESVWIVCTSKCLINQIAINNI